MTQKIAQFTCHIHDWEFTYPRDWAEGMDEGNALPGPKCPICQGLELRKIKKERDEAVRHRDLLLEVIELKQTFTKYSPSVSEGPHPED